MIAPAPQPGTVTPLDPSLLAAQFGCGLFLLVLLVAFSSWLVWRSWVRHGGFGALGIVLALAVLPLVGCESLVGHPQPQAGHGGLREIFGATAAAPATAALKQPGVGWSGTGHQIRYAGSQCLPAQIQSADPWECPGMAPYKCWPSPPARATLSAAGDAECEADPWCSILGGGAVESEPRRPSTLSVVEEDRECFLAAYEKRYGSTRSTPGSRKTARDCRLGGPAGGDPHGVLWQRKFAEAFAAGALGSSEEWNGSPTCQNRADLYWSYTALKEISKFAGREAASPGPDPGECTGLGWNPPPVPERVKSDPQCHEYIQPPHCGWRDSRLTDPFGVGQCRWNPRAAVADPELPPPEPEPDPEPPPEDPPVEPPPPDLDLAILLDTIRAEGEATRAAIPVCPPARDCTRESKLSALQQLLTSEVVRLRDEIAALRGVSQPPPTPPPAAPPATPLATVSAWTATSTERYALRRLEVPSGALIVSAAVDVAATLADVRGRQINTAGIAQIQLAHVYRDGVLLAGLALRHTGAVCHDRGDGAGERCSKANALRVEVPVVAGELTIAFGSGCTPPVRVNQQTGELRCKGGAGAGTWDNFYTFPGASARVTVEVTP